MVWRTMAILRRLCRAACLGPAAFTLFPVAAAAQSDCTQNSTTLCVIRFTEEVAGVPAYLRAANGLDPTADPVTVQRVALVIPATTGSGPHPMVVFNGGHGNLASMSASVMRFETLWPEATVVYTEAGRLLGHDGFWKTPTDPLTDTDWSPRFPHREPTADHSDLPYLKEVLNRTQALFDVDAQRIYVAGHSSGGFFTLSLMEFMTDTFRAFAALGTFADYGDVGNGTDALQEVIDAGQIDRPRAVLYLMGDAEDVFGWSPAQTGQPDHVHRTVRQLAARNGAAIPDAADRTYITDMLADLAAVPASEKYVNRTFAPVTSSGEPVVLGLYAGDHSWPPRDSAVGLDATAWIVDFFRAHDSGPAFPPAWLTSVMALPVLH